MALCYLFLKAKDGDVDQRILRRLGAAIEGYSRDRSLRPHSSMEPNPVPNGWCGSWLPLRTCHTKLQTGGSLESRPCEHHLLWPGIDRDSMLEANLELG